MKYIYLIIISYLLFFQNASAQVYLDNSFHAKYLVEHVLLAGSSNVRVENIKYTGALHAISYFQSDCKAIEMKEGILLTTGYFENISAPNNTGNSSYSNFTNGDAGLSKIANGKTYDAAILEFDFYPSADTISFNFFFGSEEYPEFVDKGVNDVFAFLISGYGIKGEKNLAVLPYTQIPITVDNINAKDNKHYYIENKMWNPSNYDYFRYNIPAGELSFMYQLDGFTSVLVAQTNVIPYEKYHIRIAIADVGDGEYDSGVFLEAGSFQSHGISSLSSRFEQELIDDISKFQMVEISKDSTNLLITNTIEFSFDSFDIPIDYIKFLDRIAIILLKYSLKTLIITGHTDNIGESSYNKILSYKRAQSIANYLNNKGISKYRINTKGMGDTKPISDNISEKGRTKNRRVEFLFTDE